MMDYLVIGEVQQALIVARALLEKFLRAANNGGCGEAVSREYDCSKTVLPLASRALGPFSCVSPTQLRRWVLKELRDNSCRLGLAAREPEHCVLCARALPTPRSSQGRPMPSATLAVGPAHTSPHSRLSQRPPHTPLSVADNPTCSRYPHAAPAALQTVHT